jgi:hypothetical protein
MLAKVGVVGSNPIARSSKAKGLRLNWRRRTAAGEAGGKQAQQCQRSLPADASRPHPDDTAILVELLRETIERDRFPLSPCIKSLKATLAKFDPPAPRPEPLPAPKPPGERSMALTKKRSR